LTNAQYVRPSNPSNPNPADVINTFNEKLTYDKNGNIKTLVRNGGIESQTTVPVIDNLVYGYDANEKNKLIKVTDATANTDGFKDGVNKTIEYGYDLNGNITRDENKGISSIVYNHLNLPTKIIFKNDNNTKIEYLYTAVGQKIQKKVFKYHQQITASLIPAPAVPTDYLGGFQYVFESLQFLPTAEGYVKYTEGASNPFDYVFNYTDHLGNIRLSYGINPSNGLLTKMEENNYYPFGLKHATYNSTARVIVPLVDTSQVTLSDKTMVQKVSLIDIITPILPTGSTTVIYSGYDYKYNGKEYQDELGLNMYDYGARNYDPAIGRWMNVDPFAEMYHSTSPYTYVLNNPLSYIDPTGMAVEEVEGGIKFTEDDAVSAFNLLTGKSKNAYVEVVGNKKDRKSMNASDKKVQNGNWSVLAVGNLSLASKALDAIGVGNNSLDNLIVSNHGAAGKQNNYFGIEDNINMDEDNSITTSELQGYNSKNGIGVTNGEKQAEYFLSLGNKVKNGGNFILNFCSVGYGDFGNSNLEAFKTLLNDRVNIYMPTNEVKSSKLLYSIGVGLNTNQVLNANPNTSWIQSTPGVKNATMINSISISSKTQNPVKIK
jgi:RHS repeat-associated protein